MGHTSYTCPDQHVNLIELEEEEDVSDKPIYDDYDDEQEDIDIYPMQRDSLVVRRVMTTPRVEEEDWWQHNIFHTQVLCGGKVCNVVLDGGSVENIISKEAAAKLKLPIEQHPQPYKIAWFQRGNEVLVTSPCSVNFSFGDNVTSAALCDIVLMDVCHILLGIPWLYDDNMIHRTRANTYSFQRGNKNYTLHPLREEVSSSPTQSKVSGFLSAAKFEEESLDMGVVYALVCMMGKEDSTFEFGDYSLEIWQLLLKFKELIGDELPKGLPPMRSI